MAVTPDDTAGPSIEEETQYDDRGPAGEEPGEPSVEGALRRVTNALRFFVGGTVRQILQVKNPPVGFEEVDMAGITNGQGLAYNSTSKAFEAQTFAGGSGLGADYLILLSTGGVVYANNGEPTLKEIP